MTAIAMLLHLHAKFGQGQQLLLTGSQRFGNVSPNSDIDVAVQYSAMTESWLVAMGFNKVLTDTDYEDSETRAVYVYGEYLHVILTNDLERRQRAQELLLGMPEAFRKCLAVMNKPNRRYVWDWAFQQVGL